MHLRGVITWANWVDKSFFVQDDSAGLDVRLDIALALKLWQGDEADLTRLHAAVAAAGTVEVEIEGESHAGGFAPIILPKTIRILGPKALPVA